MQDVERINATPNLAPHPAVRAGAHPRPAPVGAAGGQSECPASGIKGRGSATNPVGRFERLDVVHEPGYGPGEVHGAPPQTLYLEDPSRTILSRNDSPDIPFEVSLNPYRGCEHGCTYCYARPTHEYLGFSAGLDFESRILAKRHAPALLRKALGAPSWKPQVIAMSGVTDPYQPVERSARITRGCLEVLAEARNPVGLITKSALVTRDIDLLSELAQHDAVAVRLSITTLDARLHRVMEPRASSPSQRLRAIETLAEAGIPVSVMLAPVIPGLTDHEIPALLESAASAGAQGAHYLMLRLPHGVAPLFEAWLTRHYPERANKVLGRLRAMRNGRLNDPRFGSRMRGEGVFADHIGQLFRLAARRFGLDGPSFEPSTAHFRKPGGAQLDLFPAP
jgi:DNA repair photolyase